MSRYLIEQIRFDEASGLIVVPPFEVAWLTELIGPQTCLKRGMYACLLQFEAKGETVRG